MDVRPSVDRRVIFISHATPEENEFATWLGSRLIAAGYETWIDQTRLLGAEVFWNEIADVIRNRAAKVIVALSRTSVNKEGVLDEIQIAVSTARKLKDPKFVIPVRVDDLSYDDVPPNLVRKNIVDFSAGWGDGLVRVLKVLERDNVPKAPADTATLMEGFLRFHQRQANRTADAPEILLSNWFEIGALPPTVNFFDPNRRPAGPTTLLELIRSPRQQFFRFIATFAEIADLQPDLPPDVALEEGYRVGIEALLAGHPPDGPGLDAATARNLVSNLIRQAWDGEMARRGLKDHQMAHGRIWFVPTGLLKDDKAWFVDLEGRRRWRKLVGRSERRGVWWHFGISVRPHLAAPRRLILRPHIIFTTGGVTPLESAARMQRLRKSVCRNWWNDKWRDLVLAFVGWLADEAPRFTISAGGDAVIELAGHPMAFMAPISLSIPDEIETPESDDALEEVEPPDGFDDFGIEDEDDDVSDDEGAA